MALSANTSAYARPMALPMQKNKKRPICDDLAAAAFARFRAPPDHPRPTTLPITALASAGAASPVQAT
jgi:hypothetical protein